jgi:uncharacterized RDD family membrane protein YckC
VVRYRITTPEQVAFHYVVAGPVSRCMAWLTDQLLIWAGYIAIYWAFSNLGGHIGAAMILLAIFILDFSYFVTFELYWAGQSPGKRLHRIRVISTRGSRLRFADVLVRNLLRPVDMLPIAMVLGGTVCLLDRWRRRLGDLAADTIIVRDARREIPQAVATEKARINSFQANAPLRNRILNRISREERDLVMDLALRRDQIEPAVREDLFAKAAGHFRKRFALPEDLDYLSDEQTVLNLALVIQEARFTA